LGGYSPDGKWLAVLTDADGNGGKQAYSHWLVPHNGGSAVPIRTQVAASGSAIWGPRGHRLYFVANAGVGLGGLCCLDVDLQTGAPRGEAREVFRKPGQEIFFPTFVGNGAGLAYAIDEPNTRVWAGPVDQVGAAAEVLRGRDAILSPDGATVFYVDEPERHGVFAADRQGRGAPRQVTHLTPLHSGAATGSGLSLSPNGDWLSMLSSEGPATGVFIIPVADGRPRLVQPVNAADGTHPAWSPDGQWIACTVGEKLYRISRDGEIREALATLYRWIGWEVRWSPDGKNIAALGYESARDWEENNRVFVVSVLDKTCRNLTPGGDDRYKEALQWHPDGQRLTYHSAGPEPLRSQIKVAFVDGRPPEVMIDDDEHHWPDYGIWTPDGRQFVFESSPCKGDGKKIHLYDTASQQIIHGVRGGSLPRWSQDGRTQLWSQRGESLRRFEVVETAAQW
jgi:dipeptidyl aminopeptidase/acylaminoacyl peptidase